MSTVKGQAARRADRAGQRRWRAHDGATLGRWILVGQNALGRGGNGTVWEARTPGGDTRYAIKIFTSGRSDGSARHHRFVDEITFLTEHPGEGVLPLVDSAVAADTSDVSWYVMPLATPLRAALAEDSSPEAVLTVVATFAETLARLAEHGIGHRDIKPDNLFLLDGKPVIGDFGLVTFPGKDNRTEAGRKLGPANFHAPEMLLGAADAAPEPADVWSLAKTLWVLLTGQTYPLPGEYRSADPNYSLRSWITSPWISELDELIAQCTRLRPETRPSMAELARELRAFLAPPPEVRPDADAAAMRERLIALTRTAIHEQQEASRVRQRFDRAQTDLDLLHSAVYAHLHEMLGGAFREYPGQQEPNDAFNLLPHEVMPQWQHVRGALFTSPDARGRASIQFSVVAKVAHDSEQVELAACLRVLHRHQGLESTAFQWQETYTAPLGSAQFARVIAEIEAATRNAEMNCLREINQILTLPDGHVPEWYLLVNPQI